ncbi:MAG: chemotaxis protein CheW, partial [Gemmataceae bacterium]|nr:chemotaxis protein CheW [Gemmataceae bacterium]
MSEARQFCTFRLGDRCFGIDVLEVQEVIRAQPMTRVPLAPAVVRGLMNLRGRVVTALDLRRRFGLPDGPDDPVNVVVSTDDGAISLLVDDVGDVLTLSAEAFEPVPDTLAGVARELVRGVYKLDDQLLLVLDTARAVA